jgi:hypothetical protein
VVDVGKVFSAVDVGRVLCVLGAARMCSSVPHIHVPIVRWTQSDVAAAGVRTKTAMSGVGLGPHIDVPTVRLTVPHTASAVDSPPPSDVPTVRLTAPHTAPVADSPPPSDVPTVRLTELDQAVNCVSTGVSSRPRLKTDTVDELSGVSSHPRLKTDAVDELQTGSHSLVRAVSWLESPLASMAIRMEGSGDSSLQAFRAVDCGSTGLWSTT